MELPFAESWKIKMIEPIRKSTRAEREPETREKAEMIPLVRKYILENQPKGFKVSWTQWKARQKGKGLSSLTGGISSLRSDIPFRSPRGPAKHRMASRAFGPLVLFRRPALTKA